MRPIVHNCEFHSLQCACYKFNRRHSDIVIVQGKEDFDLAKSLLEVFFFEMANDTAEGVAEMFKKPLLQITCGDSGTSAPEVEKALESHFSLASRWGCILLLDEADVFPAARSKEDFKRNSLVSGSSQIIPVPFSVFLRVLEYYAGVLVLTTNRVGAGQQQFYGPGQNLVPQPTYPPWNYYGVHGGQTHGNTVIPQQTPPPPVTSHRHQLHRRHKTGPRHRHKGAPPPPFGTPEYSAWYYGQRR
ncbi:hypothetical protein VTK73DRAFT_6103 [Phialemonium thermophilum]|uniref:ATPase AAA-type core domain-containing protein n=1 Tax=Phialemonium thermophilum TaxID=223376 RepID=A0ABR3WKK6_9PEZI